VVPVITLTTDFGLRDAYVAEMKGVILDILGESGHLVQLVDITHDVQAHDITEGALALEAAALFFPRSTLHLAVVDPGVGTRRRALVLRAAGHVFVGPDNGIFTPFLGGDWAAFELRAAEYRRPVVSQTFHGRDVFAPAAAHLIRGVVPEKFGPPIVDPVRLAWPEARVSAGSIAGAVIHVDRFGNLITSIRLELLGSLDSDVMAWISGKALPVVGTYGELPRGAPGALLGSGNRLEIAVREGSAAGLFRARRGTRVVVSRSSSKNSSRKRRQPGPRT
jgi:S-adenosylmethionine hydrolase